jgi:hypothetical protein
MLSRWCRGAAGGFALSLGILTGCGSSPDSASKTCMPGAVASCACSDGMVRMTTCAADGSGYAACLCNGVTGSAGVSAPLQAGTGSVVVPPPLSGTGASITPAAGSGGLPNMSVGGQSGFAAPPAAGSAGPIAQAGRGAAGRGAAGNTGSAGSAGSSAAGTTGAGGSGNPDFTEEQLAMLRQTCVDEINMYRATLPSLKVLKRASVAQEMCSDKGAQMDGDSGQAHGSARAGLCTATGLGSEDTCPGWGVGGFSGNASVADALKGCLKAMWAEGEPPVSRAMCVQDYAGCFEKYGHYLNMSDPGVGSVACSFYHMKNGQWWMNQDFAR